MTIERLLYDISEIAIKNNLVNASYAGPSIYNVNGGTVRDYPYLFTSPTDDITVGDNTTVYGLTLYYVDRLLADSSNEVDIFSNGVETLKNIIRQLQYLDEIVEITDNPIIRLFTETQKMADACAGAYCRLEITVLNAVACPVYFDETGAPLGTYIPPVIKDQSVLENLASKNWVARYVADHITSGTTDEKEVKRLINEALKEYTKTSKFATINGSGITDNQEFDLLERDVFNEFLSGYTEEVENIYAAISAMTPGGYQEIVEQVSANTEDIATLSALTGTLGEGLEEVSGQTQELGSNLSDLSGVTAQLRTDLDSLSSLTADVSTNSERIDALSGITGGLSEQVSELSGATSQIGADLASLSAFTEQAVSSITSDVQALSGATGEALAGLLSGLTELNGEVEAISAITEYGKTFVFTWKAFSGDEGRAMFQEICSKYNDGFAIFAKARITPLQEGYPEALNQHFLLPLSYITGVTSTESGYTGGWVTFEAPVKSLGSLKLYSVSLEANGLGNPYSAVLTGTEYTEQLRKATSGHTGVMKVGSGLTVDDSGTVSVSGGYVTSDAVTRIWTGSTGDYQSLGVYDNGTVYLII